MGDDHYCHDVAGMVVISMNSHSGGQSSHKPGDDRKPKLARTWLDVHPDRLWRFVVDLVAEHTLRAVEKMAGLSKETVRKYVKRIGDPEMATRKALGELFLRKHPGGAMADRENDGSRPEPPPLRRQLIELLPRGEKEALATLSLLFGLARRFPDELPPDLLDAVQRWMELQVEGEYDWERFQAQFARRERKPKENGGTASGGAGSKPPRRKRKREAADGEDG